MSAVYLQKKGLRRGKEWFLPLLIVLLFQFFSFAVSAQGSNAESSLTARLFNIEAPVNETFRFQTTLKNNSDKTKVYDLNAEPPEGWRLVFKARGSQVTSINLEPNKSESITVEVKPAHGAKPEKYIFPIEATSGNETLDLELEAVVEGAYEIELTTPSGRLSESITEGKSTEIHLKVKNTGSLPLNEISLTSNTPPKWEVSFSPSELEELAPGKSADVIATLSVPNKTLSGDYVSKFTAKNATSTSTATYRVTVKTSLLSGGIGILIILIAVGFVYILIRKFGRR
ncbi:NEW3 domain-containing protein [uncultured Cyclobacterium sp.]|uniref:COG1470 family protein n=1 Tax=uncultured Cyclobacterium sp. TaxID=453820 RepID=UPI0030EE0C74|tara:strand:+ start:5600 stop:6457 length:858 start_codon:yes stop_codon:yes gene_type:complete